MKGALDEDEKVVGDKGYGDEKSITLNNVCDSRREFYANIRARHETCNRRLKQFRVIGLRFRL